MIKANELRLGNYLELISNVNGESMIKQVDIDILRVMTHGMKPNYEIKPIPLTEEWLLKLGYKFFDYKSHIKFAVIIDNIVSYDINFYKGEFIMPHKNKPINIKHVHQLQNLYFALTGEELTIKN
jgi:hypothetical protein